MVNRAVASDEQLRDPSSSLYWNLHGVYREDTFPWGTESLPAAFRTATILAHEQRHYLDYYLTNYGSWLCRFSPQMNQLVPALMAYDRPVPIPLRYWLDEEFAAGLDLEAPNDDSVRRAAVLAYNRNHILREDRVKELPQLSGVTGGAQLEANATAFEVGPAERWLAPQQWMGIVPDRDMPSWSRSYVWPGTLLASIGFGHEPSMFNDREGALETRLWPTLLVASLMGCFTDLRSADIAADPTVYERVLPSQRFMRLVTWLQGAIRGRLTEPGEAWQLVNEGCTQLFGETVIESLNREISQIEARLHAQLEVVRGGSYPTWAIEMYSHAAARKRLAVSFTADPLSYLDPRRYWSDEGMKLHMTPDYLLVRREGFTEVPPGHQAVGSFPYDTATTVGDHPHFCFRAPADDQMRTIDETDFALSAISRFYLNGYRSDSWIGPELGRISETMRDGSVVLFPPYGGINR